MQETTTLNSEADKLFRLEEVLDRIPVSKSTWWKGVSDGRYPKPVMLGPRLPCWRLRDIQQLMESGVEPEQVE